MRDYVSYSELSTLAKCETMWTKRYRDKQEDENERAVYFRKGTMLHELAHAWWIGGDAQRRAEGAHEAMEQNADFDTISLLEDVDWIYDRYVQRYAAMRAAGHLRVVETELKVTNPLPHSDVSVLTYVDQLVWLRDLVVNQQELNGLYVVERKSMAAWDRLDTLDVDPQVGIVLWQLRAAGWPVKGVLYDAIKTYRWQPTKPTQTALIEEKIEADEKWRVANPTKAARTAWAKAELERHPGVERPIEDSFQLLVTDRTGAQIEGVVEDMRAAVRRRAVLGAGEVPMRNVGQTCKTCSHRNECHGDIIFPELVSLRYESNGA